MRVTISGQSWGCLEGSGFPPENEAAWEKLTSGHRRSGFGSRYTGDLTLDEAEALWRSLDGYARLLSGPGLDDDDSLSRREGRACCKDADALGLLLESVA